MVITSRQNQKIKDLLKLKEGKSSFFLVEGYHLVEMAGKTNYLEEIICLEDEERFPKIKKTVVSKDILEKLSSTKSPQGIIGVCKKKEGNQSLKDKVLVLENIQDPGNVGTVLRTALSFGFEDVICLGGTASIYNEKVISSSQGAIFYLNINRLEEDIALSLLKEHTKIGTSLHESYYLEEYKEQPAKLAIFLGNEGKGMSQRLLNQMDVNLKIKMSDKIDSLNVGIAGGILLHKFAKIE